MYSQKRNFAQFLFWEYFFEFSVLCLCSARSSGELTSGKVVYNDNILMSSKRCTKQNVPKSHILPWENPSFSLKSGLSESGFLLRMAESLFFSSSFFPMCVIPVKWWLSPSCTPRYIEHGLPRPLPCRSSGTSFHSPRTPARRWQGRLLTCLSLKIKIKSVASLNNKRAKILRNI